MVLGMLSGIGVGVRGVDALVGVCCSINHVRVPRVTPNISRNITNRGSDIPSFAQGERNIPLTGRGSFFRGGGV